MMSRAVRVEGSEVGVVLDNFVSRVCCCAVTVVGIAEAVVPLFLFLFSLLRRYIGRWLGDTEETLEERRNILDKLGFEWRLRVHDDDTEGDGNVEEFSILCEGLEVRGKTMTTTMSPTFFCFSVL